MSVILEDIVMRKSMSYGQAYCLYNEMATLDSGTIGAYLGAMATKGYEPEEIAGLASAMRDAATPVDVGIVCDTCGTGGDKSMSINVSTASAILLSQFFDVAKHGNTALTSKSGSSDVMGALGIGYGPDADGLRASLEACGYCFMHAPLFHHSLMNIMPVRKALGIRTVFNILGPLASPARPAYQVIGVSDRDMAPKVADALSMMGVTRAAVVYGSGIDELNPSLMSTVYFVGKDMVERYSITPGDFGLDTCKLVPCNGPDQSARRIEDVICGRGSAEDTALLTMNTAFALHVVTGRDFTECAQIVSSTFGSAASNKLGEIRNACPLQ